MIRGFLLTSLAGALTAPLAPEAQQAGKVYRIGTLLQHSPEQLTPWIRAFERSLRDLGYVEGRNLVIEHRPAGGRPEQLADVAAEPVRLGVDIIVRNGAGMAGRNRIATMVTDRARGKLRFCWSHS